MIRRPDGAGLLAYSSTSHPGATPALAAAEPGITSATSIPISFPRRMGVRSIPPSGSGQGAETGNWVWIPPSTFARFAAAIGISTLTCDTGKVWASCAITSQ
jgi:hypothetical protein